MSSKNLSIKLKIDADGNVSAVLNRATQDTKELGNEAVKTGNKTEKSFKKSNQATGIFSKGVKDAKDQLLGLATIAAAGFAALYTIRMADAYKAMQGQLKLVTASSQELASVQNHLHQIAIESRADITAMAQLYSAMSPSFKELGKTTQDSLNIIEIYNKALALTAPTAIQSAAATLQFAQAMGSGVLRGEEFNSIMENGRGVAMTLADGLGVPIGALRAMAEQGQLTADVVIAALESQATAVENKFNYLPVTVSAAMQNMRTEMLMSIGAFDEMTGASQALADSILFASENIREIATVIGVGLTTAVLAKAVPALVTYATTLTAVSLSTTTLIAKTKALTLAMMKNPITLALVAAAGAIAYFALRTDEATNSTTKLTKELDLQSNKLQHLKKNLDGTAAEFKAINAAQNFFDEDQKAINEMMAEFAKDSAKERLRIQNQLNKLTLTETQQRALILGRLHDENRALQQKVWYIEDAKKAKQEELKAQAELNKLMDAELDIAIKKQEAMTKAWGQNKSDDYDRLLKNQLFDDNLAFDKLDAQDLLLEQTLDMVNAVDSYGDAWTRTGNKALDALGSMANVLGQVHSSDAQYTEQLIKLKNQGLDQTAEYIKLEEARAKNSVDGSMEMLKASSTMFEEGSKAQKVAHTASMVYHAMQLKMDIAQAISAATVAVATQGKGDPFTAWVRIGAMSAMMAGLLSQIGAGFSGSSGASAAVAIQPKTGSGALGGGESNSIENSLEYMDSIQADQYSELRGIHLQTKLLNESIGNAVAGLFRTDELHNMGTGYSSFKQSTLASFTSNIPLIGNAVSSALSSVFGGNRRSHQSGYGIDFDGTMGNKDLDAYSVINHHRSGGWFRRSRSWSTTSYSDLQAENESSIGLIFESMSKQAVKLGNALDMDVANQVANTDIIIGKISMAGSADDVQKRMLQAMNKQSDHLIGTVFGEVIAGYQQMGEGLAETLNRLVTNKIVVEDIISMTSQTVVGDVIALSDSLVTLAGGLSNLQDISESYFDNFYSDTEKTARNHMLLTEALSEQGLALADNRAGYRILLESLDLGTKKGLEQYHTLLKMNEKADKHFDILEKRQEELQQAQLDNINDVISKLKGLSDALNSTFDSILGSVTTDAQSYMQAQSTIFNALSEAQNGNLPELADLKKSLSVLSSNDINRYASAEAFNRDQKLTANAVLELKTLVGSEISYEDRSLALLEAIRDGVTLENSNLISAINASFSDLDLNLNSKIDFAEFTNIFKGLATASEMQTMFDGLDINNNKEISINEGAYHTVNIAIQSGTLSSVEDEIKRQAVSAIEQLGTHKKGITSRPTVLYNEIQRDEYIKKHFNPPARATGDAYIPRDGAIYELHKGEAVIDARTMSGMRRYGIPISSQNNNSELLAEIKALNKEISLLRQGNNSANSTMITKLTDIRGHLQAVEMVSMHETAGVAQ